MTSQNLTPEIIKQAMDFYVGAPGVTWQWAGPQIIEALRRQGHAITPAITDRIALAFEAELLGVKLTFPKYKTTNEVDKEGKVTTKRTLVATAPENMEHLINKILGWDIQLNELKQKLEVNCEAMNDFKLSEVRQAARKHGLSPSKDFIQDTINLLGQKQTYHPFKKAVEAAAWDGHDYITDLFNTFTVATDYAENKDLYFQYLRRWLIGVIAKVYKPGSQNLVLTLQGAQGAGKGFWFNKLSIAPGVYVEGACNPDNKDHQLRHLSYNIWTVNELEGVTRKSDMSALKDFFTAMDISARGAYKEYEQQGQSQLSFCASVNDEAFLNDPTGSRRFLIIPIEAINHTHSVNMQQVFAQAKAAYNAGEKWWFDKEEIKTINKVNESHSLIGRIEHFASKVSPGHQWATAGEIMERLDSSYKWSAMDAQKLGILLNKNKIEKKRTVKNGIKITVYKVDLLGLSNPIELAAADAAQAFAQNFN